jgi:hypothetical protein
VDFQAVLCNVLAAGNANLSEASSLHKVEIALKCECDSRISIDNKGLDSLRFRYPVGAGSRVTFTVGYNENVEED